MNDIWIKPYRDVVEQQFRLTDEARRDFDDLFSRMGNLAAQCPDQAVFATKFMQSPLYGEYTQLFQKYQKLIVTPEGKSVADTEKDIKKEQVQSGAKEYVKSMASIEANAVISHMLPDEVNRLRWGGLRVVPVIGPIIQWIDNIQWVRRMFSKNKG